MDLQVEGLMTDEKFDEISLLFFQKLIGEDVLREFKIKREDIKPENVSELTKNFFTETFSCKNPNFREIDREIISSSQNMQGYVRKRPEISFSVFLIANSLNISYLEMLEWFRKGTFIVMEENT